MGRRLRPLDPAAGPVERFACELRALRAAAGELPFWKMARRCELSKSALAAAAAGYELPSDRVARQFVEVCKGDWSWWRERLARAREDVRSAPGPTAFDDTAAPDGPAALAGPGVVARRPDAVPNIGFTSTDGWRRTSIEYVGEESPGARVATAAAASAASTSTSTSTSTSADGYAAGSWRRSR